MKLSDYASAQFLRAADLGADEPILTIESVFTHTFKGQNGEPDNEKLCIKFTDGRALALSATNVRTLIGLYGDDASALPGKRVQLMRVSVSGRFAIMIKAKVPDAPAASPDQLRSVRNEVARLFRLANPNVPDDGIKQAFAEYVKQRFGDSADPGKLTLQQWEQLQLELDTPF